MWEKPPESEYDKATNLIRSLPKIKDKKPRASSQTEPPDESQTEPYTKTELLKAIDTNGFECFFRWCVSLPEVPKELRELVKDYKTAALKLEVAVSKYET